MKVPVVPATVWLSSLSALGAMFWQTLGLRLSAIDLLKLQALYSDNTFTLSLSDCTENELAKECSVKADKQGDILARLRMQPLSKGNSSSDSRLFPFLSGIPDQAETLQSSTVYERLRQLSIQWGTNWEWLQQCYLYNEAVVCRIAAPSSEDYQQAPLHPVLLDNAFASGLLINNTHDSKSPLLPVHIESIVIYQPAQGPVWSEFRLRSSDSSAPGEPVVADITLWDLQGECLAEISGFTSRHIPHSQLYTLFSRPVFRVVDAVLAIEEDTSPATCCDVQFSPLAESDELFCQQIAEQAKADGDSPVIQPVQLESGQEGTTDHIQLIITQLPESDDPDICHVVLQRVGDWLKRLIISDKANRSAEAPLFLYLGMSHAPLDLPLVVAVLSLVRVFNREHPRCCVKVLVGDISVEWPVIRHSLINWEQELGSEHMLWLDKKQLRIPDCQKIPEVMSDRPDNDVQTPLLPENSSVLVTGGTGGIARSLIPWLAHTTGARHITLLSRHPIDEDQLTQLVEACGKGCQITHLCCDISDHSSLKAVLDNLPSEWPLKAVFHTAGINEDKTFAELDDASLARVFSGKAIGAWHLHQLTQDKNLQWFMLFSSLASVFGADGQASYAAANGFLDGLARLREKDGLPVHTINWGPWADEGMAASTGAVMRQRMRDRGLEEMPAGIGLMQLETILAQPSGCYLAAAFTSVSGSEGLSRLEKHLVEYLSDDRQVDVGTSQAPEKQPALDHTTSASVLMELVRGAVIDALKIPDASQLENHRSFQRYGLDSLLALDIRNRLQKSIPGALPSTLLFEYPTINTLVGYLQERLQEQLAGVKPAPAEQRPAPQRLSEVSHPKNFDEPVAVIGMGFRFPGDVNDEQSFWELLSEGRDAIREVPPERWDIDAFYDPDPSAIGKMRTRCGGFLKDIDQFDAGLFDIPAEEAEAMDPQHRLLLETSWEAFENAGYTLAKLAGSRTGVIVGLMFNEYLHRYGNHYEAIDGFFGSGNADSVASGRLSYFYGLEGPSLTIDTACSSSLVAIDLALKQLHSGQSDMVLAGGVSLNLSPASFIEFSRLDGLAPDGRCKTFSDQADGVSWSEGCGLVLLKRLSDALRDGDPIDGVIRASAVNQDGHSQGLTAPNTRAQRKVIETCLESAGLTIDDIDYIEAHGTGTPMGDPIELQALGQVCTRRTADRPLMIGSVKSNFGHTQAAAGLAGLIKTLLAIKHKTLPSSLHCDQKTSAFDWQAQPLRVVTTPTFWPEIGNRPARAGISSFSISGTNAHILVEEPPLPEPVKEADNGHGLPLVLSAHTQAALDLALVHLQQFVRQNPAISLMAIARTLALAKTPLPVRRAWLVQSRDGLLNLNNENSLPAQDFPEPIRPLVERYLQGESVDWQPVFQAHTPCVRLPTISFQRQRYWKVFADEPADSQPAKQTSSNDHYTLEWEPLEPEWPSVREGIPQNWQVFGDAESLQSPLFRNLERLAKNRDVTLVINPDEDSGRSPDCILVVSLTGNIDNPLEASPQWPDLAGVIKPLQHCVQEQLGAGRKELPVWLLTVQACQVHKGESVIPDNSRFRGVHLALQAEYPEISSRWLDIPADTDDELWQQALDCLCTPLSSQRLFECQALRPGPAGLVQWWQQVLCPVERTPLSIDLPETILITGGLGALGLAVAEYLGKRLAEQQKQGCLILVSRRAGPDEVAQQRLDAIGQAGCDVHYYQADVADQEQLSGLFLQLGQQGQLPDLIIHCAGVLDDGLLTNLTDQQWQTVLRPKIDGAWNLHCLTREWPETRLVMFSSISSVFGNIGQANYMTGNCYLDALAQYRTSHGLPTLSLAWGGWEGEGMSARIGSIESQESSVVTLLNPKRALHTMEKALATLEQNVTPSPVHVIAAINWSGMAQRFTGKPVPPFLHHMLSQQNLVSEQPLPEAVKPAKQTAYTAQLLSMEEAARREHLLDWLYLQVLDLLGVAPDSHEALARDSLTGLFEMGLDSLKAVAFGQRMEKQLGLELPATLAVTVPNLQALADRILAELVKVVGSESVPEAAALPKMAVNDSEQPIAIIGVGCRLPGGVHDLSSLWEMLEQGSDTTCDIPEDRFDINPLFDTDPNATGKSYTRRGAFIEEPGRFDAGFFGIPPREAESMDPQHRLLLESAWTALENAGLNPEQLHDSETGLYVGIGPSEYEQLQDRGLDNLNALDVTGTHTSFAAGRLSYWLGLQGPSLAVDTACSSSLVAIHLAIQALRNGECDLALAGGVQLLLSPAGFVALSRTRAIAPDGRCKTFSDQADGYGRGEGCGMVALRRLDEAQRRGEPVLAVIRGSAVNHDGSSSGMTVPNGLAQQKVLRQALDNAGVPADSVDFVETHGTGTPLGDPIEVDALQAVYGQAPGRIQPLRIGSIKANIGHLESAAGVAGLLKLVAILNRRALPPHPLDGPLNTRINWSDISVVVNSELRPLLNNDSRQSLRCGLSSFGISGTNVHLIMEQAPPASTAANDEEQPVLVLLSGKNKAALQRRIQQLAAQLRQADSVTDSLQGLAYTLAVGRAHYPWRAAIICSSVEQLQAGLEALSEGRAGEGCFLSEAVNVNGTPSTQPLPEQPLATESLPLMAEYFCQGRALDWAEIYRALGIQARLVNLPGYPFQGEHFWIQSDRLRSHFSSSQPNDEVIPATGRYPFSGQRIPLSQSGDSLYQLTISESETPFLYHHKVYGEVALAGAVHISFMLAAASDMLATDQLLLTSISFTEPMLPASRDTLYCRLTPVGVGDSRMHCRVYSEHQGGLREHAQGYVEPLFTQVSSQTESGVLMPTLENAPNFSVVEWLRCLDQYFGIHFDPLWCWGQGLQATGSRVLNRIQGPDAAAGIAPLHPVLLDNAIASGAILMAEQEDAASRYIPLSIERLTLYGAAPVRALSDYQLLSDNDTVKGDSDLSTRRANFSLRDKQGHCVVEVEGFACKQTDRDTLLRQHSEAEAKASGAGPALWTVGWQPAGEHSLSENSPSRDNNAIQIVVLDKSDTRNALADCTDEVDANESVTVVFWPGQESTEERDFVPEELEQLTQKALVWLKVLADEQTTARHVWIFPVQNNSSSCYPVSAPVLAMARSAQREHPQLPLTCLLLSATVEARQHLLSQVHWLTGQTLPRECLITIEGDIARVAVPELRVKPESANSTPVSLEGETLLVTGAFGSLAQHILPELMEWLRPSCVVLLGRHPPNVEAKTVIAGVESRGATVICKQCDISDEQAISAQIAAIPVEYPLTAIFHLAGELQDALLTDTQPEQLEKALSGKANGAWWLHIASLSGPKPLKYFVLFSSAAAVLGSPGQTAYSAANGFLDAIGVYRRQQGLACQVIHWGPWQSTGMAGGLSQQDLQRLHSMGITPLASEQALVLLKQVLAADDRDPVIAMDYQPQTLRQSSMLQRPIVDNKQPVSGTTGDAVHLLSLPDDEFLASLTTMVKKALMPLLALPDDQSFIDVHQPLQSLGLDSLLAVELRNTLMTQLSSVLDGGLPATLAFDYPTLHKLVAHLADRMSSRRARMHTEAKTKSVQSQATRNALRPKESGKIAVIGLGCRYPSGIQNPEGLWAFLQQDESVAREVPPSRWDINAYYDPVPGTPGKTMTRNGGFIDQVDLFDADFFGLTDHEADLMDPQQRILLETSWEAFERAGYPLTRLRGSRTGVFMGLMSSDYGLLLRQGAETLDGSIASGNSPSLISGRLSYFFDLQGPSLTVDTACSSSLVALELACQKLRAGQCDLALAGGVSLNLSPVMYVEFSSLEGMAPDGRCKPFSASADGVGWGEGCGVAVLKRLDDAIEDGDTILSVIAGCSSNHDGRSQGVTAPNGPAQVQVIRAALDDANLNPEAIDLIEAHGTGTRLGDPIEARALEQVFRNGPDHRLFLSAVKHNLGHTQAAAGISGLIKVTLCLNHEQIPGSSSFSQLSGEVDWEHSPLIPAADSQVWSSSPLRKRRAGISSFGISGTNAHIVVEEAP
ncbi:SDR family NAD(P)-dependent oxidoreductase [Parendozoicomonas haliclonae]|uniref:SDR family NAD(P)-dependent oxidoreductase n=1 Tax=Parendozoicomonas haliclonae TaxID=1960125 RepID=UPI0039F0D1C3